MGVENLDILNGTELNSSFFEVLPPEIISKIGGLITILKAAGIVFIAYMIFWIIRWILGFKRNRRINKTYKKVKIIDKKVDVLLGKKRLKELEDKKLEDTKKEKKKKKK